MGCFIGIAFWILLSGCLLARSKSIPEDFRIIAKLKHAACLPDSTFYAPTNVKEQCITKALDCVLRELEVAKVECENSGHDINNALDILDRRIEKRNTSKTLALTDSRECACERWPETSLSDFAKKVIHLFEFENSLFAMQ